jgi:murein tripeptide amidase MpaA
MHKTVIPTRHAIQDFRSIIAPQMFAINIARSPAIGIQGIATRAIASRAIGTGIFRFARLSSPVSLSQPETGEGASIMRISAAFDGGNIEVADATDSADVQLRIRSDRNSEFLQWFYFRATAETPEETARFRILNGGESTYPDGFRDYRVVRSTDRREWLRIDTQFDGASLTFEHEARHPTAYYAYFAPYPLERHADLVTRIGQRMEVSHKVLGATLDGRDLDLLRIGRAGPGKRVCWIVGRQHPGETMAEWWMEGWLERLTDGVDPVSRALLSACVFYVVPNMNPDGSYRGHLRTNAAGANLNREWMDPTLDRSPEVYWVRQHMHRTGVDFSMDVHGDEVLPYNFIAGFHGIPSVTQAQLSWLETYCNHLARINPDFQREQGYPTNRPGQGNLTMCTNYIAETFGCLAMTLEQPFKDSAITPDEARGWSPERSRALGRSCLDALHLTLGALPVK